MTLGLTCVLFLRRTYPAQMLTFLKKLTFVVRGKTLVALGNLPNFYFCFCKICMISFCSEALLFLLLYILAIEITFCFLIFV